MKLEDLLIDYIAVFPDGNLNYLKFFIKQKSNNDLINFIRIIEADVHNNKSFYNSIYMQKFLLAIKEEYEERTRIRQYQTMKEISVKQLSISAEEFIPLKYMEK